MCWLPLHSLCTHIHFIHKREVCVSWVPRHVRTTWNCCSLLVFIFICNLRMIILTIYEFPPPPHTLVFNQFYHVRFEVFTAVTMKKTVFWDAAPCSSGVNRRFGGTYICTKCLNKGPIRTKARDTWEPLCWPSPSDCSPSAVRWPMAWWVIPAAYISGPWCGRGQCIGGAG
jgi:hypothetical protein